MADLEKIVEQLSEPDPDGSCRTDQNLEETWGVSAAAPMVMAGMPMMGGMPKPRPKKKSRPSSTSC